MNHAFVFSYHGYNDREAYLLVMATDTISATKRAEREVKKLGFYPETVTLEKFMDSLNDGVYVISC